MWVPNFRTVSLPPADREVSWRHVFRGSGIAFAQKKWQIREITSDHALESTASFWGCSNVLEDLSFSSLKLAHAKSSLLSLWSYVSRHRCKEGYCPSDLKICTCSMLTLCSSMSLQLFFFHLCQTLDTQNLFVVSTTWNKRKL